MKPPANSSPVLPPTVRVVPPDAAWAAEFLRESDRVLAVVGRAVALHHIGSTAIVGIFAKPVIDMLMVADDLTRLDRVSPEMTLLGYEALGEFGIAGRRYFRKDSNVGVRTHQIHGFAAGSPEIDRHLAFRDFMNTHPEAALAYSALKVRLAADHPDSMSAYMDGKDAFVKAHERKALVWARQKPNF